MRLKLNESLEDKGEPTIFTYALVVMPVRG